MIRRPRVVVLITGDELLAPGTPARDFQIPDMNSVMIAALVARDGGSCEVVGPLPDRRSTIREAILDVQDRADLILISGGSSAGPEDHVPGIIAELGRLIAHGVALRPASPTGVGLIRKGELPVVLLPGNPVSCLCAYDFFAGLMVRRLGGRSGRWPYRSVTLPLARKLTSVVGRVDYARVRVARGPGRAARDQRRIDPLQRSAPTASSSSRPTWKDTRPVPRSRSGVTMKAARSGIGSDQGSGDPSPANRDQSIRSAHQTPQG